MIRKLLSLLLSICVAASCLAGIVFAENSYLVNYDANAASGTDGYIDLSKPGSYGLSVDTSVIWSITENPEPFPGRETIRFSPRGANTGATAAEKVYGEFVFAKDTINKPAELNKTNTTYVMEMELSSMLRAESASATAQYYYTLKGTNASGACDVLKICIDETGYTANVVNGTMSVVGATEGEPAKIMSNNSGNPKELWYLRIYLDMEKQAYRVWAVKRAEYGGTYAETMPTEANIIGEGKLSDTVNSITGVSFGAVGNRGGDKVNLSFLRVSETTESVELHVKTDEELAQEDLDAISLGDTTAVKNDFTLPTAGTVNGSAISWESSNAAIAINGDKAVVTRPTDEDVTVVLTATATKNEAKPSKVFTVVVKADIEYLIHYDANSAEGERGYINLTKPGSYGLSVNTSSVIYGIVENAEPFTGRKTIRFSPRTANRGTDVTEKIYGEFVFAKDTINKPAALDGRSSTYAVEMELSSVLRAEADDKTAQYYYTLKGTNESGDCDVVKICIDETGSKVNTVNGTMSVVGATGGEPAKIISNNGGSPAELWYLRIYVDMKMQAYRVWAVKRAAKDGAYTEAMPTEANIIGEGKLSDTVTAITGVSFGAVGNLGGDKVNLSFLRIKETAETVEIKDAVTDPYISDLVCTKTEGGVKVSFEYAADLPEDIIYVALYDGDILVSVLPVSTEQGGKKTKDVTLPADTASGGAYTVKAFLWRGDTIEPLCGAKDGAVQ